MSWWDELNDEYQDEYEDDLRADDPDDCMDCGMCDACIEQSKAYFEQMEQETVISPYCDCQEDMTKVYGGHRADCPNAILPF